MQEPVDPYWVDFERRRRGRLVLATVVWFAMLLCAFSALCLSAMWLTRLAVRLLS
jgi:hypothetical protein